MPKYFILFSTQNFLTIYENNAFEINFKDMNFKFRQILGSEDKLLADSNIGWLIEVEITEIDFNNAIAKAGEVLEFLLSMCSLETGLPIQRSKIILIYDISEGIRERFFRQYLWDLPLFVKGAEVKFDSFFPNVQKIYEFIHSSETLKYKHRVYRAVRWFRKGITTSDPLDQFLFFWHGLESLNSPLAEYYGKDKKIEKKMNKKCPNCGEKYTILVDGGIESLYKDMEIANNYRKEIKDIRNGISHGFEDNFPLSERARKMLPLMAKILCKAISNITAINIGIETFENLKCVDFFKINDFLYVEGKIKEEDLSKIGIGGYYPYFELDIENNIITPIPFIGCNFEFEEVFAIGKIKLKKINEIGSFSLEIEI
ncbi:HEPN domain-containing protein [uncultured Methanobacterium sp.]|uniref:HEPN domain-containing protein n=1 Tax=uncultured Methanobacterium sp. TaxID=176306 RepID=UPI002AA631C7|nr:HEPN domain-containing protein [uncultured Methanobacterium sp.]